MSTTVTLRPSALAWVAAWLVALPVAFSIGPMLRKKLISLELYRAVALWRNSTVVFTNASATAGK
jgi:hypothetical protein